MMMGPDKNGTFKAIIVKGLQENRVDIESASKGQTITILVKSVAKGQPIKPSRALKKGMTLVGLNMSLAQSLQKKGAAPLT
jgi:GTPase